MEAGSTTSVDLLGLVRGVCRHPDCEGCDGFARPFDPFGGFSLVSSRDRLPLFRCMRCGCPSKHHERQTQQAWTQPTYAPQLASPSYQSESQASQRARPSQSCQPLEQQAKAFSRSGGNTPTSKALKGSQWCLQRPAPFGPLCIGDLVRLDPDNSGAPRIGMVKRFIHESESDRVMCSVEACFSSTSPQSEGDSRGQTLTLDTCGLRVEDFDTVPWDPPAKIFDFQSETKFKDLIFQPGGLKPLVPALKQRRCRLCVLGGSISLQGRGYRPNLVQALERRGVTIEDMPAAVGTAGSKPLSLVVSDWVVTKRPDLLLIEVAVNDGDELLEHTPYPDVLGVLRAAEGIVRTVRRRCPNTAIAFVEMFLRDDAEARVLKSGSEAWRDSSTEDAVGWYHEVAPRIHRAICRRYGLAQIDLVPALRAISAEDRRNWFRDDCHHSDAGGEVLGNLLARLLLWSVRQPALVSNLPASRAKTNLPPPVDIRCWCNGRTMRIAAGWLSPPDAISKRSERDLLKLGESMDWLLLRAGGKAVIPFKGKACGLLTFLGPDAPILSVSIDGCTPRRLQLLDRWCYYWRDSVVLLCDGLADTTHTVELEVEAELPDNTILKRLPTPASSELFSSFLDEARQERRPPQQLWLSYACGVEGDR
eukprot:TRINITY_DN72340_c0_g1_i1.p1 TRINITY_DN72340_c0_g1~~TRINITY_DN72340_c0_g1_i1.p1  ORF type:complete len:647 (+),score=87.82 TRINITY_DN72340_c0_g1_i1:99-2039(+)